MTVKLSIWCKLTKVKENYALLKKHEDALLSVETASTSVYLGFDCKGSNNTFMLRFSYLQCLNSPSGELFGK